MSSRLALVCAISLVSFSLASCRKRVPEIDVASEEPRVVLLTSTVELSEVRAAIIGALSNRGWVTEQEAGNDITARLEKKNALVRVSIQYAVDRVTIKGLTADDAGKNYRRWLANLEESIRDGFKRAAPAPAAAPVAAPTPAPAATPAPTMVVFDAKQNVDNLKSVLQRALLRHKWVIEGMGEGGELTARLAHGRGLVRVRVTYSESQATITYLDSQDLRIDSNGRSAEYERWMRNLVDSIRSEAR